LGAVAVRLLVLSFYYEPDLSAGSFRTTALVAALQERAPSGTQVDVVTTLPNRYSTFSRVAAEIDTQTGLEVRRIALPAHRSDMLGQSRAFVHYARAALNHVVERQYDLVFATSSRLMTAALGAWIARRKHAPLYLDIRDLFVETINEVLPAPLAWPVRALLSRVESWTMRSADRINLVSRGFEGYFRKHYGESSLAWFTNGIDAEFLAPGAPACARTSADARTRVLYAGNIGEGQGLHKILPPLALALRERARFIVIGDGGRRMTLQSALAAAGADNVELRAPVSRAELIDAYGAADVLFLHLGKHPAFDSVLPSKLFEYAAVGKPILAGVSGYAARFIHEEIGNAAVFAPCDVAGALVAFDSLQLMDHPRPEFVAKFARATIARAMADDMLVLALGRS
jgi:glycosyltransferase involved in cell wall biosynthesis